MSMQNICHNCLFWKKSCHKSNHDNAQTMHVPKPMSVSDVMVYLLKMLHIDAANGTASVSPAVHRHLQPHVWHEMASQAMALVAPIGAYWSCPTYQHCP